jgi:hypothetical protein
MRSGKIKQERRTAFGERLPVQNTAAIHIELGGLGNFERSKRIDCVHGKKRERS